jgi:hypothetical protein
VNDNEHNPTLDYLLGEISVAEPWERDAAREAGNTSWPEGWWGVADEMGGFIAYFEHEEDAYGFRLTLINTRLNGRKTANRYPEAQKAQKNG